MILIPFFVLLLGIVVWILITITLGTQIGENFIKLINKFKEEKSNKQKEKIKGE